MNKLERGPLADAPYQNVKALCLLVSEKKNSEVSLFCSYVRTCEPLEWGQFLHQEHHMNKLGRGPLGDATCQISKLLAFPFQRRNIFNFSFSVPFLFLCSNL